MGSPTTTRPEDTHDAPWTVHVRAIHDALVRGNVRVATRAWDEAHLAAVGGTRWEGLIEVGDASLRIGEASGCRQASEATARKAYFAALYRACHKDSFEGILRAAAAFADLGDREVVEECVGLAELLAADDEARARIHAFLARLPAPAAVAPPSLPAPSGPSRGAWRRTRPPRTAPHRLMVPARPALVAGRGEGGG